MTSVSLLLCQDANYPTADSWSVDPRLYYTSGSPLLFMQHVCKRGMGFLFEILIKYWHKTGFFSTGLRLWTTSICGWAVVEEDVLHLVELMFPRRFHRLLWSLSRLLDQLRPAENRKQAELNTKMYRALQALEKNVRSTSNQLFNGIKSNYKHLNQ